MTIIYLLPRLVKRHLTEFEEALAKYVPVLMGQVSLFLYLLINVMVM